MHKTKLIIVALFSIAMVACSTGPGSTPTITKSQIGTVAGGAAGAAIGSQVVSGSGQPYAIAGGAILGALLGGSIGKYMDQQDQINAQQAMINVPVGQEAVWNNPNTKTSYAVKPVKEYQSGSSYCRQAQVSIDQGKQVTYTTVCRGPDGKWYTPRD